MKKQILVTAILGFSLLFASAVFAQEKSEFTISVTKNGEKIIDTTFSSENEIGLSSTLFKLGSKFIPKMQGKKDFKWVQGDSLKVVVLEDGNHTRILKMTSGDSLVKEIIIKEAPHKMIFVEEAEMHGEHGEEVIIHKGGNEKMIWVTEETEEGEEGQIVKKIIIKSAGGAEHEHGEHRYIYKSEEGGNIIIEIEDEEGEHKHKEMKVHKEIKVHEKSGYSYIMKLKNEDGKSIYLGSMSADKVKESKISSTEDLHPSSLRMKTEGKELKFDLSFELKQKGKISVNLYDEKAKELISEVRKKADKFAGEIEIPSDGTYFLKISQDKKSRLFEVKIK